MQVLRCISLAVLATATITSVLSPHSVDAQCTAKGESSTPAPLPSGSNEPIAIPVETPSPSASNEPIAIPTEAPVASASSSSSGSSEFGGDYATGATVSPSESSNSTDPVVDGTEGVTFEAEASSSVAGEEDKAVADMTAQDASNYVVGEAPGFASGTTGGAGGNEVTPTSIEELVDYLTSNDPLIILLTQKFDFTGTEGSKSGKVCASHYSVECPDQAQYVIVEGDISNTGGCDGEFTNEEFTWDVAGQTAIHVKGDKTVRGIGQSGEIVGKGLKVVGDNVIIQNVYIHDLNPRFVWGGDAIAVDGGNNIAVSNVWIDHVRVKNIGRQMVVTHYGGARSMTVSNSEFDGTTDYSASCDGRHYWTFLIYGTETQISFLGNYVHDTSGRSPKVEGYNGQATYAHVANNYWANSDGVFELSKDAYVLAEGNMFESDNWSDQSTSNFFFATDGADCSALGRDCVANQLSGSGDVMSVNGEAVLSGIAEHEAVVNYSPADPTTFSTESAFFGVNAVEPRL